jgi:hypothetical protein
MITTNRDVLKHTVQQFSYYFSHNLSDYPFGNPYTQYPLYYYIYN